MTCVARALQSAIGADEVIGRLGGDEFALILTFDGDLARLNEKLAALVGVVGDHTEANAFGWRIQASIGAAVFPEDGVDHRDLLKCADMALYAAKQSGR
ncbi:GGDEF domain-containing protein, partial [Mycobacterium tuberculosis]